MSHYFFPKISENTLHMYKLKVKKFQHASINHKKVIKKKPTGGGKFTPPPPPPCTIGLNKSAKFLKFQRNKEVIKNMDPEFCIRGKQFFWRSEAWGIEFFMQNETVEDNFSAKKLYN